MSHHPRIAAWFTLTVVAISVVFAFAWGWVNDREKIEPELGVTFSWVYARDLGFEPEEMYSAILDELGVKKVRLPIYWSEVETNKGVYQWEIPDRLIKTSEDREVELTLVIGMKVPRWPECYIPDWARSLDDNDLQKAVLGFIEETVKRYQDSTSVIRWQVENEPFFPYGECPTITTAQFQGRVDLVRDLDDRPIQVTVSGEIQPWLLSAKSADVLGISMYRETWNDLFGYFIYPLTPSFYYFRANMMRDSVDRVIVSELQAEPWFPEPRESRAPKDWYNYFTAEMLEKNVEFVKEAGLSEAYLWGAEWWYALKQEGDSRLWDKAGEVF
jgi:hypothetical protein